jgi:hypothetical protein
MEGFNSGVRGLSAETKDSCDGVKLPFKDRCGIEC